MNLHASVSGRSCDRRAAPSAAPALRQALLADREVAVWCAPLAGLDDALRRACALVLDQAERAKLDAWPRGASSDQYLVTRALVRRVLSHYARLPESCWEFANGRYGRPHVCAPAAHRSLRLNLSHTRGLVALAISERYEIGIDVEDLQRRVSAVDLAESRFAPVEAALVRCSPSAEVHELFLAFWTLKESYIKARGMGLQIALDSFWFDLGGARPRLQLSEPGSDDPGRWRFFRYAPTASHLMALAVDGVAGAEPQIVMHWLELDALARGALDHAARMECE